MGPSSISTPKQGDHVWDALPPPHERQHDERHPGRGEQDRLEGLFKSTIGVRSRPKLHQSIPSARFTKRDRKERTGKDTKTTSLLTSEVWNALLARCEMVGVGEEGLLSQEVAAAGRASATDESDELGRRRVRVSREAVRRRVTGRRTIARTTRPSALLLKEVGGVG